MKKLFDHDYVIEEYDRIKRDAKDYLVAELSKNLAQVTCSIEEFRKYKKNTKSMDDVPFYKVSSYMYKYIHSINVAHKCRILAEKSNLSEEVMALAGILHDVGHYACEYRLHGVKSAEMAMEFLTEHSSLPAEDIKAMGRIIASHCPIEGNESYYKSNDISVEEIVLIEADFWDKNDLRSFLEKTKLDDVTIVQEKYRKAQKNCNLLLNEKEEDRDCDYTPDFLDCIMEQAAENQRIFEAYFAERKALN